MEFYIVLSSVTVVIAALAALLLMRTRHAGFPIGIGLFYYWSLYGAWSIVADRLGGDSGQRYDYLIAKMFPVELNENYLWSLLLYAGFIIAMELTILGFLRDRIVTEPEPSPTPLYISHPSLLVLAVVSIMGSFAIILDQLTSATEMNISAYVATRGGLGAYHPLFTIHQSLNRIALFGLAIGIAVYLAGDSGRYLRGSGGRGVAVWYLAVLVPIFGFIAVLGNKNEVFSALILGGVLYLYNTSRIRWGTVVPLGLTVFLAIGAIDFLRALPVLALLDPGSWWEAFAWAPEIRSSNEAFAPHFSMYGVLNFHPPLTYGSSFMALAMSIVPRLLWPDRPEGTYVEYAESLGIYEGETGQGYTVHHATGWYLNFGLGGLLTGAVILGLVWAACYNAHLKVRSGGQRWATVLAIIAPAGFVSYVPPLVRAGPDAYKGMIIEAFIIPTFVVLWGSVRWRQVLFRT